MEPVNGRSVVNQKNVPANWRRNSRNRNWSNVLSFGQLIEEATMKLVMICAAVGLSLAASVASAQEARIGVGVGPVGAGVTVGQSPSHERRTTVIKEREPRDETVVIRKERREPRDKVIIRERD